MVVEQTAASHSLACEATALLELLEQFRSDDAKQAPTSSNCVHHRPADGTAWREPHVVPLPATQGSALGPAKAG
ncbi:hypothetical protein AGR4C_pc30065 [Agrobacterium tumefaciens str. Kerr 14]|uniref:Uncharacterized protein n=1 Tax=Agrobacterium tumefaciens str. Kerr 14 TaxID=1183424 RepID=A0A1S7SG27_AGRTU|nr:hypothetical protein AGR4C_pc30065 [Agrobacterium tumefaciens str. Kerr 14]